MTDLATLKSKIALFAGAAPQSETGFFACFGKGAFDGVHLNSGSILARMGADDDLMPLAQDIMQDPNREPAVFVCAAHDDPDQILFCGTHDNHVVLLRTRDMSIAQLMQVWRAHWTNVG